MVLTFPKHRQCHLDWVQARALSLCMLVASAHLLGMHGPENTHINTLITPFFDLQFFLFFFRRPAQSN